jgi:hypothetical protein
MEIQLNSFSHILVFSSSFLMRLFCLQAFTASNIMATIIYKNYDIIYKVSKSTAKIKLLRTGRDWPVMSDSRKCASGDIQVDLGQKPAAACKSSLTCHYASPHLDSFKTLS